MAHASELRIEIKPVRRRRWQALHGQGRKTGRCHHRDPSLRDLVRWSMNRRWRHSCEPRVRRHATRSPSAKCSHATHRLKTGVAGKDPQLAIIRNARAIMSERVIRVARPAPILDRKDGPLIAVRLNILTRKSLGGLETDLHGSTPCSRTPDAKAHQSLDCHANAGEKCERQRLRWWRAHPRIPRSRRHVSRRLHLQRTRRGSSRVYMRWPRVATNERSDL